MLELDINIKCIVLWTSFTQHKYYELQQAAFHLLILNSCLAPHCVLSSWIFVMLSCLADTPPFSLTNQISEPQSRKDHILRLIFLKLERRTLDWQFWHGVVSINEATVFNWPIWLPTSIRLLMYKGSKMEWENLWD